MAKRGRKRGAKAKRNLNAKEKTQPATSIGNIAAATPKVHPATNDCYPLNKLCRLCLLSNTNMEPIFPFPGDNRLAQKIFQCTNLEIKENSNHGIPNSICGHCKKQLDQCYEFRLLCWKNDEILHNLHAILSPQKKNQLLVQPQIHSKPQSQSQPQPATPSRANPVVQVQKLDLSTFVSPSPIKRGVRGGGGGGRRSFGEVSLSDLYTPSRRGHKGSKIYPTFSRELVVRLTPISSALINKYKKAAAATKVTQTKAAMKSFPQAPRGRPPAKAPPKPVVKAKVAKVKAPVFKALSNLVKAKIVKAKVVKPQPKAKPKAVKVEKKQPKVVAAAAAAKKPKAKRAEFSVPPKKRKQNFETAPPTVATATCVLCSQTFTSVKSLGRHMTAHENGRKDNRVFNCDLCKKEYLKGSQFSEHLDSAEHISNVARDNANEGEISILPDEAEPEVSILPDADADDANEQILPDDSGAGMNDSVESSANPQPEPEEITAHVEPAKEVCPQPSPDTNDNSQQDESSQLDESTEPECIESGGDQVTEDQPPAERTNTNRDASPIPVDDESSRSREDGVQYSDVCSTNNAENLFNGSGADALNASRRVTFSDITEIVD